MSFGHPALDLANACFISHLKRDNTSLFTDLILPTCTCTRQYAVHAAQVQFHKVSDVMTQISIATCFLIFYTSCRF